MSEIDILIQKYLQGETTVAEDQQLYQWIHESTENEKHFFTEKDIWDTVGFHSNQKAYASDLELELLKQSLTLNQTPRPKYLNHLFRIAAMLLLAFGLGWGTHYILLLKDQAIAPVSMQEIFVPKGQVNQLFLADGTRIWINSESRVLAPSKFSNKERAVKLSGEAFFEVAKDKSRPFRVEVNGQKIEVLGTSFNVRAYENSNEIETTLEKGEIRLINGNKSTILKAGEQSLFDRVSQQLTLNKVDPALFCAWKDGRYTFQNEDLLEVFKVVERWYDVEIDANADHFKGMHFTGVIKRNKDAKHFFELLNHTIPINYEINFDKILITHKYYQINNKTNPN